MADPYDPKHNATDEQLEEWVALAVRLERELGENIREHVAHEAFMFMKVNLLDYNLGYEYAIRLAKLRLSLPVVTLSCDEYDEIMRSQDIMEECL